MTQAIKLLGALFLALLVSPTRGEASWVGEMLARLSLEEKAFQVQMVHIRAALEDPHGPRASEVQALVRDLGAGGIVAGRGDARRYLQAINRLQELASLPLLVASDFDWSGEPSAQDGITRLPTLMAIGAAGSEALAERAGRVAAREGRALGLRMMLAPVVDVNTNPDNPIINIRSFGEDARAVARLASAFIRGARSAGMLTTAKHFPGHGATALDSHLVLPTVTADRARLDAVELLPFRAAIGAGVDAVMVGHLAVPALDASGAPATVSKPIVTGLLRGELGFRGLILTDSMEMRALADAFEPGEAAVLALDAGADMLLASPDPRRAAAAIVEAVRAGRLSPARLDAAVLQVLRAKAAMDLDRRRQTPPQERGREEAGTDAAAMQELAERSITLVRDDLRIVPLKPGRSILHITLSAGFTPEVPGAQLATELRRLAPQAEQAVVQAGTRPEAKAGLIARAASAQAVIVSIFLAITPATGSAAIPDGLAHFVRRLVATGAPVVIVSYSSPYLLRQFPQAPAYLCAYGSSPLAQTAAMKALFGESAVSGRLPVSLPGLYPLGHGLMLPARQTRAAPP